MKLCATLVRGILQLKNDVHLRKSGVEFETAPWGLKKNTRKLGVETAMHIDDVDETGQTDISDVSDILTSREETS